jgi:GTP-binding protein
VFEDEEKAVEAVRGKRAPKPVDNAVDGEGDEAPADASWNDDAEFEVAQPPRAPPPAAKKAAPRVTKKAAAAAAAAAEAAAYAGDAVPKAKRSASGPTSASELFQDAPPPSLMPEGATSVAEAAAIASAASAARRGRGSNAWAVPVELLPKIAIVGRPNVGKSALFNRITGTNDAIVHDTPGVTRDRRYTRAEYNGRELMFIDTGGLMQLPGEAAGATRLSRLERAALAGGAEVLPGMIEQQAAAAVAEATMLIVVMDGQVGLTTADEDIITWLRRKHPDKPFVLAVNKCESPVKGEAQASAFWELGVEPTAVSAISSTGVGELLDRMLGMLPAEATQEDIEAAGGAPRESFPLRVAIVGRPNVGKSSILNCLAGEVRSIVNDQSGTTTDAIDAEVTAKDGRVFKLIDTAGIRRRAKVAKADNGTEELAVERAMRAMRRADVVALVLDAKLGATEQDYRIATLAASEGCALVIVVNKWDTVPDKDGTTMVTYEKNLRVTLRDFPWAPVVFTTATTGQRIGAILRSAAGVGEEHARRVSTGTLNAAVRDATAWKAPPARSGRKGRVYYATQAASRPPTFVFFVNDPELFPESYVRFLERSLRDNIGFKGTPVRLLLRGKANNPRPERGPEPSSQN